MGKRYEVVVSSSFAREYRKLLERDAKLLGHFVRALARLEENPYHDSTIKKLGGIRQGEGVWRIRLGAYRIRYDLVNDRVVLHTIDLRKDVYR